MAKTKAPAAKSGSSVPTPETREERFLAKAAGEDVTVPSTPYTRLERYLAAIAENAGGSELPTVVPVVDDGKVLITNNGEWVLGSRIPTLNDTDNGYAMVAYNREWIKGGVLKIIQIVEYPTVATQILNALTGFLTAAVSNSGSFTYYPITYTDASMADDMIALSNDIDDSFNKKYPVLFNILGRNVAPSSIGNGYFDITISGTEQGIKYAGFFKITLDTANSALVINAYGFAIM